MTTTIRSVLALLLAAGLAACSSAPVAKPPRYSVETTPLEALEAAPAAQAAVRKHMPTIFEHPAYAMFKPMTLRELLPYSQGALTEERLKALQSDLEKLQGDHP